MVTVPPSIALVALGEDVTILPNGSPPGTTPMAVQAVVSLDREPIDGDFGVQRAAWIKMAISPTIYGTKDKVTARGTAWVIQSVEYDSDPAWIRYYLRKD